jgi:antitoxin VapB
VDVVLPFGDGALGFDLEEQRITGVDEIGLAIGGRAGHAGFFGSCVIGIVDEVNRRAAFGDAAGHVQAGPGDAALDGGAGFFLEGLVPFLALVLRATVNFYRSSGSIMSLTIQDANAEQLARRLAEATGESIPQAVVRAIEERWQKLRATSTHQVQAEQIIEIAKRGSALPELDRRSPDSILGYADDGSLQ